MAKIVTFLLAASTIVGLALGVYWLLWKGWCFVLPEIYPTGPAGFIQPSYWVFTVAIFILTAIGRNIFGGNRED